MALINQQGINTKKVTIGKDVWIGAGCKILMGVKIGNGAVIGAGSVVTQDVLPYHVVAGNPVEIIKKRS
jgi:acetyltransferase-like isoleucine patch superfamily enzyme